MDALRTLLLFIIYHLRFLHAINNEIEGADNNSLVNYLNEFGYLEDNYDSITSRENIKNALMLFQEYFNLHVDGEMNNETEQLIKSSRCGVRDYPVTYKANSIVWKKNNLSWHYALANDQVLNITQKAFQTWSKNTNLVFYNERNNPDILISDKAGKHKYHRRREDCLNDFDKEGGVLAHAFFPNKNNSIIEVHMDSAENWDYSVNGSDKTKTNLLAVLIHEIGHSLGLAHSNDPGSIMYPFYSLKFDLNNDDILGIQSIYGTPPPPPPTPTTFIQSTTEKTTTLEETAKTTTAPIMHINDLCEHNLTSSMKFVIINHRLYILKENLVWIVSLRTHSERYDQPYLLTNWVRFLPKNYKHINGVYQRPSGEVVLIVDNIFYMFDINTLRLIDKPKALSYFNIPETSKIHGIVNTYLGETFLLYDNMYYMQIDECSFTQKRIGAIFDLFPSIPLGVEGAFRYINGLIYFFKGGNFYAYNQFIKGTTKMSKLNLEEFNVRCPQNDFINSFKNLIANYSIQLRN